MQRLADETRAIFTAALSRRRAPPPNQSALLSSPTGLEDNSVGVIDPATTDAAEQGEQPKLRNGARIAVAGYGRGTYIGGMYTVVFDSGGLTVSLDLQKESWTVLTQTASATTVTDVPAKTVAAGTSTAVPRQPEQSNVGKQARLTVHKAKQKAVDLEMPWMQYPISSTLLQQSTLCSDGRRGSFAVAGDEWVEGYHGTSVANALRIIATGFQRSRTGMLGPGVYWSDDVHKTTAYTQGSGTVLKLMISNGKTKVIDNKDHPSICNWSREGYDSAYVPPNTTPEPGWIMSGLSENCTYDPSRITVVAVSSDYGCTFDTPQQFIDQIRARRGGCKLLQKNFLKPRQQADDALDRYTKSIEAEIRATTLHAKRVAQRADASCVLLRLGVQGSQHQEVTFRPKLGDMRTSTEKQLARGHYRQWFRRSQANSCWTGVFGFPNHDIHDDLDIAVVKLMNLLHNRPEPHARLLRLLQQVDVAEATAVAAVAALQNRVQVRRTILQDIRRDIRRERRERRTTIKALEVSQKLERRVATRRERLIASKFLRCDIRPRRTITRPRSNYNTSSKYGRRI